MHAAAFLDASNQFIFLAFDELQIIIRQAREALLQFAFGNVPIRFEFKDAHTACIIFNLLGLQSNLLPQLPCRKIEPDFYRKFPRKSAPKQPFNLHTATATVCRLQPMLRLPCKAKS
jgi:hypothetical protein